MAVLNRFTNLLSADVHAVLDKLEDPLASLKLAVREMECALNDSTRDLQELRRKGESLGRQERLCTEQLAELKRQLDTCFESEQDGLAKSVLRNKLRKEKQYAALSQALIDNEHTIREQEKLLRENEQRLAAMREKLALVSQQRDTQTAKAFQYGDDEPIVNDEDVEVAYLQEKQKRARR